MDIASAVLPDQVVTRLEALILDGVYKPGEKLREQSLATELGVSRGPLREAIRTLEGRRLLRRTPHSGVEVAGASVDELNQLLLAREALEGMSARLAAENMTSAEVQALRDAVLAMETRPEEVVRGILTSADNDFHRLIARGSRNRWLEEVLMRDLYALLRLQMFQAAKRSDLTDTKAEHRAIIDRIHARDGEGAEQAMRAHIRNARERTIAAARATG